VASDASGDFVVVWESENQDGSERGVFGQRFDSSGAPLGPEFRVNTFTTHSQVLASVAADSAGNFVVVWTSKFQTAGYGYDVFGQRYAATGAPLGAEFRVNTYTTLNQGESSVAVDGAGNFIVVWTDILQDSGSGVFGQRFAPFGNPTGPEFRVNTYTIGAQHQSRVKTSGSGDFVVVWTDDAQDGGFSGVFGQRYAASGAPLGGEFRVNTNTTSSQSQPSLAVDASGAFVVVWESFAQLGPGSYEEVGVLPPQSSDIFGQRYASTGAPLGSEFRVNTFTTNNQYGPVVAADGSGNFVVVWSSYTEDGSLGGVFGQRYAASGAPLGTEFRVNTLTSALQNRPSVAADSAGDFVVVWKSDGQDGSFYGVFGQRYSQMVPIELMQVKIE
jgi:hypothetical protein